MKRLFPIGDLLLLTTRPTSALRVDYVACDKIYPGLIGKTWTRLIKHGLIKNGGIKHGLIKHGVMKPGLIKHAVMKHGLKRRFYGSVTLRRRGCGIIENAEE